MDNKIYTVQDILAALNMYSELPTRDSAASILGCDIKTLYRHSDYYRVCKKNGRYIQLN